MSLTIEKMRLIKRNFLPLSSSSSSNSLSSFNMKMCPHYRSLLIVVVMLSLICGSIDAFTIKKMMDPPTTMTSSSSPSSLIITAAAASSRIITDSDKSKPNNEQKNQQTQQKQQQNEIKYNNNQSKSKRRKPYNNRVAIQWIIESVEKVLEEEHRRKLLENNDDNSDGTAEMKMIMEMGQKQNDKQVQGRNGRQFIACNTIEDDVLLLDALRQIQYGKSRKDTVEAGNDIVHNLKITQTFSFDIQERVMKILARAGMVQLASRILESMVVQYKYVPSSIGYVAVLNGLRRVKKLDLVQSTLMKLSNACQHDDIHGNGNGNSDNSISNNSGGGGGSIDVVALNAYLGAISDVITTKSSSPSSSSSSSSFSVASKEKLLMDAFNLLQPNVARETYSIGSDPDTISFNTVLNAAISMPVKNSTLINDIIQMVKTTEGVVEDIYTYNLRLKACENGIWSTADKIAIVDEILSHPTIRPDKYTIELSLLPLAREGRIGDILELLRDFNYSCDSTQVPPRSISNAYSTFLIALVKGGEIYIARSIFDTYILPSLTETQGSNDSINLLIFDKPVKPITRHFNVLLEGYRALREKKAPATQKEENGMSPLLLANSLFDFMVASDVRPDAYTLTSMLGLQMKSIPITNLWIKSTTELGIPLTPPVYHCLITAYGRANDPSSACYMFDHMVRNNRLSRTLNSWNVILSALSKIDRRGATNQINCLKSIAFKAEGKNISESYNLLPGDVSFIELVDGKTAFEAAAVILEMMKESTKSPKYSELVLRPNSQSYCLIASTLSHRCKADGKTAIELYRDAMEWNVPADGRFINSLLRCFGSDIDSAIHAWKTLFRPGVLSYENRERSKYSRHKKGKNLVAAYHGIIHVAGTAGRPDIALRIAYAMKKEGLEPTELTLNSYKTGARNNELSESIRLNKQYENLLTIECTKYNKNDKRRSSEKRVRIII